MNAEEICKKAGELVGGDRAKTHGDKFENHLNIARLWSAYLGCAITPEQVALMMGLLKIARTKTGTYNPDDFIDLVGYASIAGDIAARGQSVTYVQWVPHEKAMTHDERMARVADDCHHAYHAELQEITRTGGREK